MMRTVAAAGMLLALTLGAAAEPPRNKDDCLARVKATAELVQRAKLSDEMRTRIDDEILRAQASCGAGLFAAAERAIGLAERLVKGEPDPE